MIRRIKPRKYEFNVTKDNECFIVKNGLDYIESFQVLTHIIHKEIIAPLQKIISCTCLPFKFNVGDSILINTSRDTEIEISSTINLKLFSKLKSYKLNLTYLVNHPYDYCDIKINNNYDILINCDVLNMKSTFINTSKDAGFNWISNKKSTDSDIGSVDSDNSLQELEELKLNELTRLQFHHPHNEIKIYLILN